MRILFVASLYYPHIKGGAEIVLQRQAEALAARGHGVAVYTLAQGAGEAELNGVRIHRATTRNIHFHGTQKRGAIRRLVWHGLDMFNVWAAADLFRFLRNNAFDIVVFHNLPGLSIAAWTAVQRAGLAWIQVLHDQYLMCPRSTMFKDHARCETQCGGCAAMRVVHPRFSRKVPAVVGVSSFVIEKHRSRQYFGAGTRSYVLHNVTAAEHSGSAETASEPEMANITFAFVGTVAPNKGVEDALQAFEALAVPGAKFLVAGRGETSYLAQLSAQFRHPGIRFVGYVDGATLMERIDCLVVPSIWEDTLPSVVFEALSRGTPVLGSDIGGIPEMIRDGSNGRLFQPGNVAELVGQMRLFVDQLQFWRNQRSRIAYDARSYIDIAAWTDRWERILTFEFERQGTSHGSNL